MSKRWLRCRSDLRERLLRAGIAPRYVRRYLCELTDHLADLEAAEGTADPAAAEAAALARLGSVEELAGAMEARGELRAWSARAPWLVFSLGALVAVAAVYLAAGLLLWTGWHLFVPYSATPFVRITGVSIVWFGVGRLLYFTAPVLVGWGVVVLSVRQRLRMLWPAVALAVLAVVGATAQVRVSHWGAGLRGNRVSMSLNINEFMRVSRDGHTAAFRLLSPGLWHVLLLVAFTALPYIAWRARRALLAG